MAGFLEKILASTREDLEARKRQTSLDELKSLVKDSAAQNAAGEEKGGNSALIDSGAGKRSLTQAVARPGISVIAEVKRASPSKGDIRPDLDVADIVKAYEQAGAAAISVLTEPRYFKGSLDDLVTARKTLNSPVPILRKDFIVDPYQIWEAAAAGADAILLIVAALTTDELSSFQKEAADAGLECLVETHDPDELQAALASGAPLIGINNRDLRTFEVTLQTTLDMIGLIPDGVLVVSESGIATSADVARLAEAGVDAVLVGETLMRSADPGAGLRQLLS
ncbi:MAG: indole-3-glycerol phosphate synthase TrpC [Actinobacteria bacterium]|nr:indole-3-glycerol phosphate synthase TrpC [Actinomycetota bacterium]